jgi:hypothetical protein
MNETTRSDGDRLEVRIEAGASFVPFVGPSDGTWRFQLTQEVPVTLKVETGASQLDMDLTNVLASHIELETGASNSNVVMPSRGVSLLDLEAGAASINITIPQGVAGRIRIKEGLTSLSVDTTVSRKWIRACINRPISIPLRTAPRSAWRPGWAR